MTDDFLADKLSSMTSESKSAYAQAGVDIDAQDKVLAKIKKLVRSTFTDAVLSDVGSFGGLFKLGRHGRTDSRGVGRRCGHQAHGRPTRR
jgi:phosphoribosylformylglycinamidine cyclo-ligase